MRIKLSDEFLRLFPEAGIHVLIYEGVERVSEALAQRWKERASACVAASQIPPELLVERPEIREWRDAYSRFGLKPGKYRSSIEQLWKRALQGSIIRTPVQLVNVYCYASLLAFTPMGGYDLDRLRGDIAVRLANGNERFTGIGEKQALDVPPGTVVYADEAAVICFGWNHRDAACASLLPETRRAIFFADSASASGRRRAANGVDLLREALDEAGCKLHFHAVLDAEMREIVARV